MTRASIILYITTAAIVLLVASHYAHAAKSKNVTIEMYEDDYSICYMDSKELKNGTKILLENCNVFEIDNNRFRLLSSFNEFLAFGDLDRD